MISKLEIEAILSQLLEIIYDSNLENVPTLIVGSDFLIFYLSLLSFLSISSQHKETADIHCQNFCKNMFNSYWNCTTCGRVQIFITY